MLHFSSGYIRYCEIHRKARTIWLFQGNYLLFHPQLGESEKITTIIVFLGLCSCIRSLSSTNYSDFRFSGAVEIKFWILSGKNKLMPSDRVKIFLASFLNFPSSMMTFYRG